VGGLGLGYSRHSRPRKSSLNKRNSLGEEDPSKKI
jgi:hypothetical protein